MPIFRGKQFVSAISDSKDSVRVASHYNVSLTTAISSIDNITLVNNDRVLLACQSNYAENGIYIWNSTTGILTRSFDADSALEISSGMRMYVEEGNINAQTHWTLTTYGQIIIGTTELTFVSDRVIDGGLY